MKTKKNDFLLTLADLDEQLIKKADPYNDSKTVKAKPGVLRTRALVIVSATALAALLGVVVIKTGMFGIRKPSGEEPIRQDETAKKVTDVPPMTPEPNRDDIPPSAQATVTPTPTPVDWKQTNPTPTVGEVGTPTPAPTSGAKQQSPYRVGLTLDEVKKSPYFSYLPDKLFQYYEFVEENSFSDQDKFGEYSVLWFAYRFGESEASFIVRVKSSSNDSNFEARRVRASETERYDITKYEAPYSQTVPKELLMTMENPVFSAEELTRDVLLKRIVEHRETNDTKYRATLSVEKDGFVFECYYEGMIVADAFPAFGMNPIPDKIPPTGNN